MRPMRSFEEPPRNAGDDDYHLSQCYVNLTLITSKNRPATQGMMTYARHIPETTPQSASKNRPATQGMMTYSR